MSNPRDVIQKIVGINSINRMFAFSLSAWASLVDDFVQAGNQWRLHFVLRLDNIWKGFVGPDEGHVRHSLGELFQRLVEFNVHGTCGTGFRGVASVLLQNLAYVLIVLDGLVQVLSESLLLLFHFRRIYAIDAVIADAGQKLLIFMDGGEKLAGFFRRRHQRIIGRLQ